MSQQTLIAFDLDDTLFKERDFVLSGHRALARHLSARTGMDEDELFDIIHDAHPHGIEAVLRYIDAKGVRVTDDVDELVDLYRFHTPDIHLVDGVEDVLECICASPHVPALITDGNARVQRAKIEALGLNRYFSSDAIIISGETGVDKYTAVPFEIAERRFPTCKRRIYVGDNMAKDFYHARRRGWLTAMLVDADGVNVHSQTQKPPTESYRANLNIFNLKTILTIL